MTLTYTGQEASNLLHTVFPQTAFRTINTCKENLLKVTKLYNCTPKEAYSRILNNGCQPTTAIYLFVALYQIENEAMKTENAIINAIKQLEDEKQQLADQMFILEHSDNFPDRNTLRQVYIEQLAIKDRQIQQYINAFNVVNPINISKNCNR